MEAIKYNFSNILNDRIESLIKGASIITVTDSLGRIEFANDNFCKILERDVNQLIREPHELLKSHLHSENLYKDLWRTIKMGRKWNGVLSDKSLKGKLFWLDTTIIPVRIEAENTIKYVGVYNDITETETQKNNLLESNITNSKYRSVYQSINVGIIVIADYKGNITEWNQGAELAFGYSKLEILGKSLTVLTSKKYRRGNIKELIKAINKINGNQNIETIEMYCLRKNGEEFPVEFALSSLNVDDNCFYCAVMLDITKRKNLEDKLKQKTKDLELFLSRSAHDLKAPFTSAEGLLNLLQNEVSNDRAKFLTNILETTIKRGKLLVDNLIQASIISLKKLQSKNIDFNQTIDNVLSTLSGSKNFELIKFNIEVISSYDFNSNSEMLSSLFQNLIQNAIKYSKNSTEECEPQIDVFVESFQNRVEIKISDNGQGVDEGSIGKIFDLYYRANKEAVPGNGLGLYIVKTIVEDLNGEISVKSNINKGTCFEIVLPSLI